MGLVPCLGLFGPSSCGGSVPFIASRWEPDGVLCPVTDATPGQGVKVVSSFGASLPPCFPYVISASRGEVLLDANHRLSPRAFTSRGRFPLEAGVTVTWFSNCRSPGGFGLTLLTSVMWTHRIT